MYRYPGQPARVTNGYSKIHLEYLDWEGLWVYEVSYDNRKNGPGVGAIVTKLYPGATKFTSNMRKNVEGTVYRTKTEYENARVQMIAIPKLNQIMIPANSRVWFYVGYSKSLNEVDDRNIAEDKIFSKQHREEPISPLTVAEFAFRSKIWRAAQFSKDGSITGEVTAVTMGEKKFDFTAPVKVEANLPLDAVKVDLGTQKISSLVSFVESNFKQGYDGLVELSLKGSELPMGLELSVHTAKTAEAAGIKIVKTEREEELLELAKKYNP